MKGFVNSSFSGHAQTITEKAKKKNGESGATASIYNVIILLFLIWTIHTSQQKEILLNFSKYNYWVAYGMRIQL